MHMLAVAEIVNSAALGPISWLGWCIALWVLVGRRTAPPNARAGLTKGAIAAAAAVAVFAGFVVFFGTLGASDALGLTFLDRLPPRALWWIALALLVLTQSVAAWAWLIGRRRAHRMTAGRAAVVSLAGGVIALLAGVLIQLVAVAVAFLVVLALLAPASFIMVGEARRHG